MSGPNGGKTVWPREPGEASLDAMNGAITLSPTGVVAASAEDVVKIYGAGDTGVRALDHVSVELVRGEFTAIMGPSGSGKSTLMHCLAGLDSVTAGTIRIGDVELSGLSDKRMTALRRDRIGFVFQSFNLVPTLTALENITLPIDIAGRRPDQAWLDTVITTLGLGDRLAHRPSELSGGQQQRVACARALSGRPDIVFGDEPTGTSTPAPAARCSASCVARSTTWARRSSSSRTTPERRATPTGCSSSPTDGSWTSCATRPLRPSWTR